MPVIITNQPNIKVLIESIGEISLRRLTFGDRDAKITFELVRKKDITDKEFVKQILFNQLTEPILSEEEFSNVPEEDLKKIAKAFISTETSIFKNYVDTGDTFTYFKNILAESVEEYEKHLREILEPLFESSAKNVMTLLEEIGNVSQYLGSIKSVTESYSTIFKNITQTNKLISSFKVPQLFYLDEIGNHTKRIIEGWDKFLYINSQVKSNYLASLASVNVLSQLDSISALYESGQQILKFNDLFTNSIKVIPSYSQDLRREIEDKIVGSVDEIHGYILSTRENLERQFVYTYWKKSGEKLQDNAERICEEALSLALSQVLSERKYKLHRQPIISNGRIDILIDFYDGRQIDTVIIELKVFRDDDNQDIGVNQTLRYLDLKRVKHGYRIIFNSTRIKMVDNIVRYDGRVLRDIVVNINPARPSDL